MISLTKISFKSPISISIKHTWDRGSRHVNNESEIYDIANRRIAFRFRLWYDSISVD